MPHSVTPESTPAEETSQAVSLPDTTKPESETPDVAMEDAPTAAAAEAAKVKLEELFDDADSDPEFPSSVPAPTSQEDASQPAPMYAPTCPPPAWCSTTNTAQQDYISIVILRPRCDAGFLPASLSFSSALSMAQPFGDSEQRLCPSRVRFHAAQRRLPTLPVLSLGRSTAKAMHKHAALTFRNRPHVQHQPKRPKDAAKSQRFPTADEGIGL